MTCKTVSKQLARRVCRTGVWLGLLSAVTALTALTTLAGCGRSGTADTSSPPAKRPPQPVADATGVFHVEPGEDIQSALDAAASSSHKRVVVHAGEYRPGRPGQALLRFNRRHDGIVLEADGRVVLTAGNEELVPQGDPSYPAAVNHVVYFGDGITPATVLRGFEITGANGFVVTDEMTAPIESPSPGPGLERGLFFYADGGAVKVFGRSAPTLEHLVIRDNHSMLCAGGISIEQRGYKDVPVVLRHIQFLRNTCPGTGAAVDVLGGSEALIENCLFVENIGNTGMDRIAEDYNLRYNSEHGCGALTVFPDSQATVRNCTFLRNWNGVDDHGSGSVYERCLFWGNDQWDHSRPGEPYEMDLGEHCDVRQCVLGGNRQLVLRGQVDPTLNRLGGEPPTWSDEFAADFGPGSGWEKVGYRPAVAKAALAAAGKRN